MKSGSFSFGVPSRAGVAFVLLGLTACKLDAQPDRWRTMLGGPYPSLPADLKGDSLQELVALEDLPERIDYKPGILSLVADPSDTRGNYMTVYLINDTDVPVPDVIGELSKVRTRVLVGGHWISDQPIVLGCGTVPPPRPLAARTALAMGGWAAQGGAFRCERKFLFAGVVSDPVPGFVARENIDENLGWWADNPRRWDHADLTANLSSWHTVSGEAEELIATVELARHQGQFIENRTRMWNWIMDRRAEGTGSAEQEKVVTALVEVLGKPWLVVNDQQSLVSRSLEALRSTGNAGYGTPEKCRATVWNYLIYQRLKMNVDGEEGFSSESHPADEKSLKELAALAEKTMTESGNDAESAAAGRFLAFGPVAESEFPTAKFQEFLKSGDLARQLVGLAGVSRRGQHEEAGAWLTEHLVELEAKGRLGEAYDKIQGLRGPVHAWEYAVINRLLETDPLQALRIADGRMKEVPREKLPAAWPEALRKLLRAENQPARREWWRQGNEARKARPNNYLLAHDVGVLTDGLYLLARWSTAEDEEIFRQYLDHPAARFEGSGSEPLKMYFSARYASLHGLRSLKITEPSGVVTEMSVIGEPPAVTSGKSMLPRIMSRGNEALLKNAPLVASFLGGSIFSALLFCLLRKRKRPAPAAG